MLQPDSTSAASRPSVQQRSLQSRSSNLIFLDHMYHLPFRGCTSGLKCIIDRHQIGSGSALKLLFRRVMYPTSLFVSGLRCSADAVEDGTWNPLGGEVLEKRQCSSVHEGPGFVTAVVGRVPGTVIWCTKKNKITLPGISTPSRHRGWPARVVSPQRDAFVLSPSDTKLSETGCCYGFRRSKYWRGLNGFCDQLPQWISRG